MRAPGTPPKAIARALGVRPAVIAPLVRQVAAERPEMPIERSALVACWISPSWSRELIVERRDGWDDVDLGPDGPAGIVLVLVARRAAAIGSVCAATWSTPSAWASRTSSGPS